MGILNVTPDSFSDGGQHDAPEAALAHARALIRAGASIIDVGGESTRPGAERVSAEEELRRVVPVVRELAADGVCVSVDTMRAEVALETVRAGATIINDVSGALADPDMPATVADARTALGAPPVYVAMHWRGHSTVMMSLADYTDAPRDVIAELRPRLDALVEAGLPREHLVLDPGLGFAKDGQHNWEILAAWEEMSGEGLPILIGASRKRFTNALTGETGAELDRDDVTAAISAYSALMGAWCVRVHAVAASAAACAAARALREHAR